MSMDVLQERIRKLKCPILVDFSMKDTYIPPVVRQELPPEQTYVAYCLSLLPVLREHAAGVRFSFDRFALDDNLPALRELLRQAMELGYYVLLDAPQILTPWAAEDAARVLLGPDSAYPCHGLVVSPWIGSDSVKPFLPYCREQGKSIFLAARTANRSAPEMQDLMIGARLTHAAAAELANRYGEAISAACAYSQLGVMTAATGSIAVSGLRSQYKRLFLLVDGIDYPGGNAKNCSYAFDRFGHGAAVCAGPDVTAAWLREQTDGADYADLALKAVDRLKGNIARYVTIL